MHHKIKTIKKTAIIFAATVIFFFFSVHVSTERDNEYLKTI